jgi:hypothetical protein
MVIVSLTVDDTHPVGVDWRSFRVLRWQTYSQDQSVVFVLVVICSEASAKCEPGSALPMDIVVIVTTDPQSTQCHPVVIHEHHCKSLGQDTAMPAISIVGDCLNTLAV